MEEEDAVEVRRNVAAGQGGKAEPAKGTMAARALRVARVTEALNVLSKRSYRLKLWCNRGRSQVIRGTVNLRRCNPSFVVVERSKV